AEQYNPPKPPPPPIPIMPGDIIETKVAGAEQFNFKATVSPEGKIEVSFIDNPLVVQGLTDKDLTGELVKALGKQLKAPQVSVTVTKNPNPMPTPTPASTPKPSPTPTPTNPQMVVPDLQRP